MISTLRIIEPKRVWFEERQGALSVDWGISKDRVAQSNAYSSSLINPCPPCHSMSEIEIRRSSRAAVHSVFTDCLHHSPRAIIIVIAS